MSLVIFSQTIGGTLFLTFAQTIFSQGLLDGLKKYAPAVNPQTVITAGATAFRNVVDPKEIAGILNAYSTAINHVFYLVAASSVGVFVTAWGLGWVNIKKKKSEVPEA
jgi:hypothetical protein